MKRRILMAAVWIVCATFAIRAVWLIYSMLSRTTRLDKETRDYINRMDERLWEAAKEEAWRKGDRKGTPGIDSLIQVPRSPPPLIQEGSNPDLRDQ